MTSQRPNSLRTGPPGRAPLAGPVALMRLHEYLVLPGQQPTHMHLLIDGWAARYRLLQDGRRQVTGLFLPGDFCDLLWLDGQPSACHVIALTPIRSARIPMVDVLDLAQADPGAIATLHREALSELRLQTDWLTAIGRMTAAERVARLLLELAERCGADRSRLGSCAMPLTQLDIADACGLTAVHVNRTLQMLRRQSLIELANRRLRILDAERLARLAILVPPPVDRALKAQCQRLVRVTPRG